MTLIWQSNMRNGCADSKSMLILRYCEYALSALLWSARTKTCCDIKVMRNKVRAIQSQPHQHLKQWSEYPPCTACCCGRHLEPNKTVLLCSDTTNGQFRWRFMASARLMPRPHALGPQADVAEDYHTNFRTATNQANQRDNVCDMNRLIKIEEIRKLSE